eukprot:2631273-Rhodomonas_salina.1
MEGARGAQSTHRNQTQASQHTQNKLHTDHSHSADRQRDTRSVQALSESAFLAPPPEIKDKNTHSWFELY